MAWVAGAASLLSSAWVVPQHGACGAGLLQQATMQRQATPVMMGRRMAEAATQVEDREYMPSEAIALMKKLANAKFVETAELHGNLNLDPKYNDQQIRTTVSLPHGTGKSVRVAVLAEGDAADKAKEAGADIVGFDDLIEKISAGELDFEVLLATPPAMPKLAKLGKVLGPKGLMPSPKAGTVSADPASAVSEFKAGKLEFRTDKQGIVHVPFGKVSLPSHPVAWTYLYTVHTTSPANCCGSPCFRCDAARCPGTPSSAAQRACVALCRWTSTRLSSRRTCSPSHRRSRKLVRLRPRACHAHDSCPYCLVAASVSLEPQGVSSLRQRHAPPPQVHRVARARCGRRPTLPQPWVRASDLSSRPSSRVGMFPSEAVHELRVLYRALHCHGPRFGSTSGECGPAITRMPELVRWVSFGRHAHGGWRNGSCRAQRMAAHDSDGDNRSGSRAEDLVLLARAVTRTGVRRQCTRVN